LPGDLIDDTLEFVEHHKDKRNYVSKAAIVRKALGDRAASELTPQELERWLRDHCKTAGTAKRYKTFISLCNRDGNRNGKVTFNPARMVRHPKRKRRTFALACQSSTGFADPQGMKLCPIHRTSLFLSDGWESVEPHLDVLFCSTYDLVSYQ